ncbi:MAG: DNA polymerase, partial [Phycisphaerales bacterium]
LGYRTTSYEEVAGKGAKQISFAEVAVERAARYAVEDAVVSLRLHRHFQHMLKEQPGPARIYRELEMPLIEVLGDIERSGVCIDVDELARQGEALRDRLNDVEARARASAGAAFNLGSPKQIQEILFERLGLPVLRKTPKGQPSTAEDVLQEL